MQACAALRSMAGVLSVNDEVQHCARIMVDDMLKRVADERPGVLPEPKEATLQAIDCLLETAEPPLDSLAGSMLFDAAEGPKLDVTQLARCVFAASHCGGNCDTHTDGHAMRRALLKYTSQPRSFSHDVQLHLHRRIEALMCRPCACRQALVRTLMQPLPWHGHLVDTGTRACRPAVANLLAASGSGDTSRDVIAAVLAHGEGRLCAVTSTISFMLSRSPTDQGIHVAMQSDFGFRANLRIWAGAARQSETALSSLTAAAAMWVADRDSDWLQVDGDYETAGAHELSVTHTTAANVPACMINRLEGDLGYASMMGPILCFACVEVLSVSLWRKCRSPAPLSPP